MTTARSLLLSLLLSVSAPAMGTDPVTYPPAPGQAPPASRCVDLAQAALHGGRAAEALRYLLTCDGERGSDPAHARALGFTYLALDRPMRAAEAFAAGGEKDASLAGLASLVLRWQRPEAPPAAFRPQPSPWPGVTREALRGKSARGILAAPDGSLWVMGKDRIWSLGPGGETLLTVSMPGACDLNRDGDGGVIALGSRQVLWRTKVLPLGGALERPLSAAETPDGSLLLLDGKTSSLVRLDASGRVTGRTTFALDDPVRVRVDGAGRIYLLESKTRCVYIYSASFAPLTILDPERHGYDLRKASELFVDDAGDMLLLDGGDDVAVLFSAQGRFLGVSRREDGRLYAIAWDGSGSFAFLDLRGDRAGRMGL